jgi:hypothetical protein
MATMREMRLTPTTREGMFTLVSSRKCSKSASTARSAPTTWEGDPTARALCSSSLRCRAERQQTCQRVGSTRGSDRDGSGRVANFEDAG